jgi:hypothetical protein
VKSSTKRVHPHSRMRDEEMLPRSSSMRNHHKPRAHASATPRESKIVRTSQKVSTRPAMSKGTSTAKPGEFGHQAAHINDHQPNLAESCLSYEAQSTASMHQCWYRRCIASLATQRIKANEIKKHCALFCAHQHTKRRQVHNHHSVLSRTRGWNILQVG